MKRRHLQARHLPGFFLIAWVGPSPCYSLQMRLLLKWLLSAVALLMLAQVYSAVQVTSFGDAMIAALAIGLLNTFVRPLLVLLTLPVTILTVGLFLFVINAFTFWAASRLLDGFQVTSFGAALLGSILYSILGIVIDSALQRLFTKS